MSSDSLSSQVVQCQLVMLSVYHLRKGDNAVDPETTELHIFCPLAAPKRPDLMMSTLHGNRLTYCQKEKLSL